jgi:MFS family permease
MRSRDFRLYMVGNVLSIVGLQMQAVAIGWEIYDRTHEPLNLAYIGLVQVLPVLSLALITGQVADRFDRKRVVGVALAAIALASFGLAVASWLQAPLVVLYACLLLAGVARAFLQPAKAALLPQIVPRSAFSNAVAWTMSGFQLAAVSGPAIGGLLIALFDAPAIVYACDAAAALTFCAILAFVRHKPTAERRQAVSWHSLTAGAKFVGHNKVLLGAMALDMFAVLLGGATTLLPIYARDILHVGPSGLGWLLAAPAIGALTISFVLTQRPPLKRAGRALLSAVTGFGLATIVFGFSESFWLSLAMLFLTGACDNVSVVVRHTLVQLLTPDAMRGRVSAVNGVFISASNELGGFESGLVASLFTPLISVVSGGVGTLCVVALVAWFAPQLRRFGPLTGVATEPVEHLPTTLDPAAIGPG